MIAHLRSRSSESEYLASCEQLSTGPFSICNTYNVSSFAILHPGNDDVCIKQMLRGLTGGDEDGDDDCDDDGDDDDDDDDGDADAETMSRRGYLVAKSGCPPPVTSYQALINQ